MKKLTSKLNNPVFMTILVLFTVVVILAACIGLSSNAATNNINAMAANYSGSYSGDYSGDYFGDYSGAYDDDYSGSYSGDYDSEDETITQVPETTTAAQEESATQPASETTTAATETPAASTKLLLLSQLSFPKPHMFTTAKRESSQ
ncbi:MAG: hypothetical protein LUG95_04805 [Clostridiales bacterium]|nr:hypothetical protein [Clostridiales bacterium]